ncbi:MAG: phosphatidylserine decarboxylase [Eubacteriales bacterium]|nr:phosphatidylserine decarboxylase [Eubacteriales bacterium]MDY3333243.1 phosphatidylserine decarboxylase [Gallibacter sp.]
MQCKNRKGEYVNGNESQDRILRALYNTKSGRGVLRVLIRPAVSKIGGLALKTRASKLVIKSFVRNNAINMHEYEDVRYDSYNEFFIRKIRHGVRPIDMEPKHFVSPCDSKLSVYKIDDGGEFVIKDTRYTFKSLTRSDKLMDEFRGGLLMVFRLSVDDYHRYSYVDDGVKTRNITINGKFHTVNPLANDVYPIYKENQREISLLKSKNFGLIMMMEVGALMVGKIVNYHQVKTVSRGEEKGRFEFGGSTVILAVKPNVLKIDEDILKNSSENIETKVKLGEKIGEAIDIVL